MGYPTKTIFFPGCLWYLANSISVCYFSPLPLSYPPLSPHPEGLAQGRLGWFLQLWDELPEYLDLVLRSVLWHVTDLADCPGAGTEEV